ncbi:hypothetical protein ACFLT7_07205 [candidate division KSB1 bacterium]
MIFIDGLHGHEIVLLVLGVLLFLVLLFLLIFSVVKQTLMRSLILYFVLPIVMIGYSGIKTVSVKNTLAEIEIVTRELEENPDDENKRNELNSLLSSAENRPFTNQKTLLRIAEAQLVVGDSAKAQTNVNSVLGKQPNSKAALELRNRITPLPRRVTPP